VVSDGNSKKEEPRAVEADSFPSEIWLEGRGLWGVEREESTISSFVIQESRRLFRWPQAFDISIKVDPAKLAYKEW
jgi:hypothetical protein